MVYLFVLNFLFQLYNDNPFRKRVRDGEFPLLVTQGTSQFPTYGLAVVVKKEFLPLEASLRYASRGRNSFSTTPAKPCVGNWDVPFVTRRGIHFLPLVASPLVVGNIPSLTLFLKGLGHLHQKCPKTLESENINCIYIILLAGSCSVNQECISIKKCPYTKELFAQVKSTSNPDEKAQLIQAIRLRVCGEPSDRTVCCDVDQGKGY